MPRSYDVSSPPAYQYERWPGLPPQFDRWLAKSGITLTIQSNIGAKHIIIADGNAAENGTGFALIGQPRDTVPAGRQSIQAVIAEFIGFRPCRLAPSGVCDHEGNIRNSRTGRVARKFGK